MCALRPARGFALNGLGDVSIVVRSIKQADQPTVGELKMDPAACLEILMRFSEPCCESRAGSRQLFRSDVTRKEKPLEIVHFQGDFSTDRNYPERKLVGGFKTLYISSLLLSQGQEGHPGAYPHTYTFCSSEYV